LCGNKLRRDIFCSHHRKISALLGRYTGEQ
jgi:hypothetical protein